MDLTADPGISGAVDDTKPDRHGTEHSGAPGPSKVSPHSEPPRPAPEAAADHSETPADRPADDAASPLHPQNDHPAQPSPEHVPGTSPHPHHDLDASPRPQNGHDHPPTPADDSDISELRRYAEGLLTHLAADGTVPQPPPRTFDIPAYWPAPAIEALLLILSGDDALEPLARAAQLDETRTALFLCLSLAVSGHGDRVHASWLGTVFGELSTERPVTPGQRALWMAAARGAYGPAGKIFVLRKLDAAAVPSTAEPERWLSSLVPDQHTLAVSPALTSPSSLAEVPELARPVQAAARLTRLLERCTEITSTRPSAIPRAGTPGPWPDTEPLTVLRSLIGAQDPGPLGSLTGHLLDDVQQGSDPHLAAIAFHVAAPVVRSAAADLVEATRADPPTEITVPIRGHQVTLRPEGPDTASLSEAEARIRAEAASSGSGRWLVYATAVLPIVALALAFTVSELYAVASLVLGGVVGYLLWRLSVREQAESRRIEAEVTLLREEADTAVWALHDYAREADQRAETAAESLTALTRLLRRGPAVAEQRP